MRTFLTALYPIFSAWQSRRVVISQECISFAFINEDEEIDRIPFEGIDYVKAHDEFSSRMDSSRDLSKQFYVVQVATNPAGHNSGRTYYLRTSSNETYNELVPFLTKHAKAARKRALASTLFQRAQLRVRNVYRHIACQSIRAVIIIGVSTTDQSFLLILKLDFKKCALSSQKLDRVQSFVCTILESQYGSELVNPDGSSTAFGASLDRANLFFTVVFTTELLFVAFSSWFVPFVTDMWCWLDMFVVSMSIVSLILTNEPTGIARVMRALRILRLFGRLKSLRKILSALALALVPVCQVFLILFILLCFGTFLGSAHAARAGLAPPLTLPPSEQL